jgi:hypothetical protein
LRQYHQSIESGLTLDNIKILSKLICMEITEIEINDKVCLLLQPSNTGIVIGFTDDIPQMVIVKFDSDGQTDTVLPLFLKAY